MRVLHLRQSARQAANPAVIDVGEACDTMLVSDHLVVVAPHRVANDIAHAFRPAAITRCFKETIKRLG